MPNTTTAGMIPALPFIHLDADGTPSLRGSRCTACGTVLLGERRACACCGARNKFESVKLSERGTLYTYTIIQRSFPGVKTPFVAAAVDLEGGGTLKGTLLDVKPDPSALPFDMPVKVVFRDSGQRDAQGKPFLTYYFVPATGASA